MKEGREGGTEGRRLRKEKMKEGKGKAGSE
jgi:hypothetical protein